MHTILYVGSTTDLSYEQELLAEWGKHVQIATCAALPAQEQLEATGTDDVVAVPVADPLLGVEAVVIEQGELDAETLHAHRNSLTTVVILDDQKATVDIDAATDAYIWVTRATNRNLFSKLPFVSSAPSSSARRHALQDALAGMGGERPSGRVNEL